MSRRPARRSAGRARDARHAGGPQAPRRPPGAAAGATPGDPSERLQKMLARTGLASRREAEGWIRAGRLTINGVPATLGARVGPHDRIQLDGRSVRVRAASAPRAFLCHRSPGEPLATPGPPAQGGAAPAAQAALLERLPRRAGRRFIAISPMPRVDGGLELVTADGELAVRLQRSVHGLLSEFGVRLRGELADSQRAAILAGTLDSGAHLNVERCEPAGGEGANRWYTVAVRGASGKQVRQLLERQGALVSRVLRTRLGPVALERTLGRGHFRELTREELRELLASSAAPRA